MLSNLDNYILGIEDSIDKSLLNGSNVYLTEFSHVKNVFKKRKRNSHKGTYGKIGFISGSKGMAGAAILNINAAFRCGSGLIKAFIPDEIYYVVEAVALEAITCTYNVNDISFENLQKEIIDYSTVLATGSGCANITGYYKILNYILNNSDKPLVIDAEGINQLSINNLKKYKGPLILTPHYGEMAKLLNVNIDCIKTDTIKKTIDFSLNNKVYLVLKGARTIIACPDGQVFINTTGNPGMATAGSGDVLTGIIASLIGQGIEIKKALRVAVFVHGLAGDIGIEEVGEYSLIASDLIKYLPAAIKTF